MDDLQYGPVLPTSMALGVMVPVFTVKSSTVIETILSVIRFSAIISQYWHCYEFDGNFAHSSVIMGAWWPLGQHHGSIVDFS